jgi:hypothetical protein
MDKRKKIYEITFRCPHCHKWAETREMVPGLTQSRCYYCGEDIRLLILGYQSDIYRIYVSGPKQICFYDVYDSLDNQPYRICTKTMKQCLAIDFSMSSDGYQVDTERRDLCPGYIEGAERSDVG